MANIPVLPSIVGGSIRSNSTVGGRTYINDNSVLNNYPYEFTVTLDIDSVPNLDQTLPNLQFDASTIYVGQWLLQNTGFAYMIVQIVEVVSLATVTVIIRDVDMYNAISDPSQQGSNYPSEGTKMAIFSLSEDGTPIILNTTFLSGGLQGSWLNDALGKFAYRNFIETYYTLPSEIYYDSNGVLNTNDYSSYSVGQIVYIGQSGGTGPYKFLPVDVTNISQVEKAFGTITSLNQPELGNIYVRPFGKVITTLPFTIPGNIGDVLYYDSTDLVNPGTHVTIVKPTTNPIPLYIKITDTVASVLYGGLSIGGTGKTFKIQTPISTGSNFNFSTGAGGAVVTMNEDFGTAYTPINNGAGTADTTSFSVTLAPTYNMSNIPMIFGTIAFWNGSQMNYNQLRFGNTNTTASVQAVIIPTTANMSETTGDTAYGAPLTLTISGISKTSAFNGATNISSTSPTNYALQLYLQISN